MNAQVKVMRTPAEQSLLAAFNKAREALPGASWVREMRDEAMAAFERTGLPHRRLEAWKWTDLRSLLREARPLARGAAAEAVPADPVLGGLDAHRLVFVNGRLAPALSAREAVEGVEIRSLSDVLGGPRSDLAARIGTLDAAGEAATLSLNTAFMTDGAVIRVGAGVSLDRPIHLVFVAAGAEPEATYLRNLVVVEDGAAVTLVESHHGPAGSAYQTNVATELFAGAGARLRHVRLQDEGAQSLHLHTMLASVGAQAEVESLTVSVGAAVARNQLGVGFAGDGARLALRGVSMLGGRQHVDTTLAVDHGTLGCESRELFKTVLDGEARGVFQGKIIVRPGAQKTDGRMMSQALFLSEGAEFDGKPELEIYADDVQCGHGATAGQLDEDQLFYLMARGMPRPEAERLLITAFIGETLEAVAHEGLREALAARAERWLAERRG